MTVAGTKRERLLDWMSNGDSRDVPVLMLSGRAVAASYLGKEEREVTWPEVAKVAEATGTHAWAAIGAPLPFDVVPFLPDFKMTEQNELLPDGVRRRTRRIETPEGTLQEVLDEPKSIGAYRREFYVKGDKDLPAFGCFIRAAMNAVSQNPSVRRALADRLQFNKSRVGGTFPTYLSVNCPAFELMSSIYMDQATALYFSYDHQALMEELIAHYWKMTQTWLELGVESDVDLYQTCINGLEWLSPGLYERYMIPQTRRLSGFAAAHGKLTVLHTCGKLKKLAETNVYQRMNIDILESLSAPPTGDIENLAETRRQIGQEIVTRGGINVELFYENDPMIVKRQAEHVLACTAGFRHMLGDTNDSIPAYPWENVQAVVDVVRAQQRLFE